MAEKPRISIVVLSYNLPELTEKCLQALATAYRPAYEVILIDNGSDAATKAFLRSLELPYPILSLFNKKNLGVAGGLNQAFKIAQAEHVYWLQNDMLVQDPEMFEKLLLNFQRYKKVGTCVAMTNYVNTKLQRCLKPERLPHKVISVSKVDHVSAMFSKECLKDCGGFDEAYTYGNYEDTDFCMKAREKGWQLLIDGNVWILHLGSMTFRKFNLYKTCQANRELFLSRWGEFPEEKVFNLE